MKILNWFPLGEDCARVGVIYGKSYSAKSKRHAIRPGEANIVYSRSRVTNESAMDLEPGADPSIEDGDSGATAMNQSDAVPMQGVEFIFDPIAKTALIIRDDVMIAVPGRFATRTEAITACLRVVGARYVNAYRGFDYDL